METKRACRISKLLVTAGYKDKNKYDMIYQEMIDQMIRIDKAIKPYIKKLKF